MLLYVFIDIVNFRDSNFYLTGKSCSKTNSSDAQNNTPFFCYGNGTLTCFFLVICQMEKNMNNPINEDQLKVQAVIISMVLSKCMPLKKN